jgi:hypothetical protein
MKRNGTQRKLSHNIHSAHLAFPPSITLDAINWIPDPPTFSSNLFVECRQLITAINSSVREYHRIILDDALRVMRIRNVTG